MTLRFAKLAMILCGCAAIAACSSSNDGGAGSGGMAGTGGSAGSGGSGGGTGEATIGPDGGSVTTTDGRLTLTVPPGALGEDVEVRIAPIDVSDAPASVQALPGALTVYDLQPAGLQFANPATLAVKVPDAVTTSESGVTLQIAFLLAESNDVVESLPNQTYAVSDSVATTANLGADISHFSSAIVQLFEGATFSADAPAFIAASTPFDVTVTVDIEGAGLGTINQATQEDASVAPVTTEGAFDESFVGSDTVQTSTNTYTCAEGGSGRYRTIVGIEVDSDLGPITATTLSQQVTCSQQFEVPDDRPGGFGRAEGSSIAAYSTGTGVTVINTGTGEVLQRVIRTDENEFGFPTSAANVFAPGGPIQAVIATTSAGVESAVFGAAALTPAGTSFIPEDQGFEQSLQYTPGMFAAIGGAIYFFQIGDTGIEQDTTLNGAFAAAGNLRTRTAYVQPAGFAEGSPILAIRSQGNPAADPPLLSRFSLSEGSVVVEDITERLPLALQVPLGQVKLRCLPDPSQANAGICGIAALGGRALFRWITNEQPNSSLQNIAGSSGGTANFIDIDIINTSQGTRFASASTTAEIRVDDVAAGLSGSGLTTHIVPTPGACGPAVGVEFRSEKSLLVSCLDRDFVVTLDIPDFGEP